MENRFTQADIIRVQQLGEDLQKYRKETLAVAKSLYEVASQFRTSFKGLKKATIAGSSVTLLGGTLATTGFILSFATLGASCLLTAVGIGIIGFGSLVTGGSALVEFMQQKKAIRTAEGQINIYDQTRSKILKEFEEISVQLQPERIGERFPIWASFFTKLVYGSVKVGWSVAWNLIHNVVHTIHLKKAATEIAMATCETAGKITAASVQATTAVSAGFHMAGGVLGIAMIPLNIGFLVHHCNAVSTDKWPETSRQISETADKLLENCPDENEITEMIDETVRIMTTKM